MNDILNYIFLIGMIGAGMYAVLKLFLGYMELRKDFSVFLINNMIVSFLVCLLVIGISKLFNNSMLESIFFNLITAIVYFFICFFFVWMIFSIITNGHTCLTLEEQERMNRYNRSYSLSESERKDYKKLSFTASIRNLVTFYTCLLTVLIVLFTEYYL